MDIERELGHMANLIITRQAGVVTLELNRPERRHALSLELLRELNTALEAIAQDRTARVVVLSSSGKVFCSGHDLGEMTNRSEAEYTELFSTCSQVMLGIRRLPQPVIARVQGFATAAGCQLVAACDLAVASEEAQFATPGVKIGLFCTTPMVALVRSVPPKLAMEMLLTGQPINAQRALAAGLVNRVVPASELDAAVAEFTTAICQSSPFTVGLGKCAFYDQLPLDETTAYGRAVDVMTNNALTYDAQEGMTAFLEKRSPEWRGE